MANDQEDKTRVVNGDTVIKRHHEIAIQSPPALVVLSGPTAYIGQQFFITEPVTSLGRTNQNLICIEDVSLSRFHAELVLQGDFVQVRDLGSTNKTSIENRELEPHSLYKLRNQQQIKFGNVVFKFLEKGSLEIATHQAMYDKAQKDALTGIYSKRALLEMAPSFFKKMNDLKHTFCLMTFDIDFFKKINDGYGHPGGDFVLQKLAQTISAKLIRANDLFIRYGGEEFIILLPDTPQKEAAEIGERLRQTIEKTEFDYLGKKIPVTISIGLTELIQSDMNWEALYDRADQALYHSKQNGRNRLTFK